jgi:hypothetical protein
MMRKYHVRFGEGRMEKELIDYLASRLLYYHGSGPADLALAILVDYFRERPPRTGWLAGEQFSRWTVDSRAFTLHQDFKREVVARFGDEWELSGLQIDTWLKDRPQR